MEWLSDNERFSAIDENLKIINDEIAQAALASEKIERRIQDSCF